MHSLPALLSMLALGGAMGCATSTGASESSRTFVPPATSAGPAGFGKNQSERFFLPTAETKVDGILARQGESEPRSHEAVPGFALTQGSGEKLESQGLVGQRAFAVVFFATWCELCARKMPMIRRAFEKTPGVELVLVSVDSPVTYHHVPGFLREQRMGETEVVSGLEHPGFTQAYNPVSSIPLVAVVGRSGALVDYQIGLQSGDGPRLESSLRKALLP